jgi:hypothetical protein
MRHSSSIGFQQLHLLHEEGSRRGLPQSGNPRVSSYFAPASKALGPGRKKPEGLSQATRLVEYGADCKCVIDQLARSAGSLRRAYGLKFKRSPTPASLGCRVSEFSHCGSLRLSIHRY